MFVLVSILIMPSAFALVAQWKKVYAKQNLPADADLKKLAAMVNQAAGGVPGNTVTTWLRTGESGFDKDTTTPGFGAQTKGDPSYCMRRRQVEVTNAQDALKNSGDGHDPTGARAKQVLDDYAAECKEQHTTASGVATGASATYASTPTVTVVAVATAVAKGYMGTRIGILESINTGKDPKAYDLSSLLNKVPYAELSGEDGCKKVALGKNGVLDGSEPDSIKTLARAHLTTVYAGDGPNLALVNAAVDAGIAAAALHWSTQVAARRRRRR